MYIAVNLLLVCRFVTNNESRITAKERATGKIQLNDQNKGMFAHQ
jgi:hypothetical protein